MYRVWSPEADKIVQEYVTEYMMKNTFRQLKSIVKWDKTILSFMSSFLFCRLLGIMFWKAVSNIEKIGLLFLKSGKVVLDCRTDYNKQSLFQC